MCVVIVTAPPVDVDALLHSIGGLRIPPKLVQEHRDLHDKGLLLQHPGQSGIAVGDKRAGDSGPSGDSSRQRIA